MNEQRDETKRKSKYHRERKERARREETASHHPTHTPQEAKTEKHRNHTPKESKAQQEPPEGIEHISKSVVQVNEPYKVTIPKVLLSVPAIKYDLIKMDTEYSIKKKKQRVQVSNIKINAPILEFHRVSVDSNVTMTEKARRFIKIPRIRLHAPVFVFQDKILDLVINISPNPNSSLSGTSQLPIIQAKETQSAIQSISIPKHETRPLEITQETEAVSLSETGRGNWVLETETGDFMKALFGVSSQELREPNAAIILFKDIGDEGYIHLFEKLLLRLQREKGKMGKAKKLTLRGEDWNKEEIERWLDEGGIIFIEVANRKILDKLTKRDIADRLWAIFSKGDGTVVFHTKDDDTFYAINELVQDLNWNKLGLKPEIFKILVRELPFEEKLRIIEHIYGFVPLPDLMPGSKVSWIANTAEKQYLKALKRIMHKYEPFFPVRASNDESTEHVLAKYFIIHTLIKRLQREGKLPSRLQDVEWDKVRTIIETEPESYPRPDVLYKPEDVCFEFETLFGESFRKITNKLDEYTRAKPRAKVHIVVEPITVLLHLHEFKHQIAGIKKGKLYSNLNVEYYTFNLSTGGLVPLDEFIESLSGVLAKLNEDKP
ncbi:hypothetical protein [Thermococcus sp.]|uniref:hypothetical protein n=1 Tax=Thermococcus sp. TaxID=35749 RepID=UPI002614868C|nr:hypothetical protein [Thermococcus sp.]